MAGESFEQAFGEDGTLTWRETHEQKTSKPPTNGRPKTDKRPADAPAP